MENHEDEITKINDRISELEANCVSSIIDLYSMCDSLVSAISQTARVTLGQVYSQKLEDAISYVQKHGFQARLEKLETIWPALSARVASLQSQVPTDLDRKFVDMILETLNGPASSEEGQ